MFPVTPHFTAETPFLASCSNNCSGNNMSCTYRYPPVCGTEECNCTGCFCTKPFKRFEFGDLLTHSFNYSPFPPSKVPSAIAA